MSIRFYCPLGHRLKVPDHRVGKKGRCPVCRERVVVPSVSLPRVRKIRPSNGAATASAGDHSPAEADHSPDRPLRTFDQLAADFLTRETEIGIAEKMAAITNLAAIKASPPADEAASELASDILAVPEPARTQPALQVAPVEKAAAVASTPLAATLAINEPVAADEVTTETESEGDALELSLASATPPTPSPPVELPLAVSPPVASPPAASPPPERSPAATSPAVTPPAVSPPAPPPPPPTFLPSSLPSPLSSLLSVPPPIMTAAPPRAAVAMHATKKTTRWAWATRDTIAQFHVHRPTAPQLESTYWLASLLPFAIVLCAAPAVGHLRLNAAPVWAQAMLLLSGAQLAYAVWLALLPDYSTLRIGMFLFAASAVLDGLAMVVALSSPAWLDLSASGLAAVWCGGCLAAMSGLSYACAKVGDRWVLTSAR